MRVKTEGRGEVAPFPIDRSAAGRARRAASALRWAGRMARLGGWELDPVAGTVLWSEELSAILGYGAQEREFRYPSTIFFEEDAARFGAAVKAALAGDGRLDIEVRVHTAGGELIWLHVIGEAERAPAGCAAMRGVAQDVTARKQTELAPVEAQRRAAQLEARLELGLTIAETLVWEVSLADGAVHASGPAHLFFDELPTLEAIREAATVHPEDRPRIVQARERLATGTPYQVEYRLNRANGREMWVSSLAELVRDADGAPQRLIGVMKNITSAKTDEASLREARDAAQSADQAKSTFLANIGHEIRTPLNGILGLALAMAADELSPEQRARLDQITQSGQSLGAALNDLLDLSKIEAGRLELADGSFDARRIVREVHASFLGSAREKGLDLALTIDAGLGEAYRGDAARVRQLVHNLVSNAVKFTDRGGVEIDVRPEAGAIAVRVTDTGCGVPADLLEAIFERFVQVDTSDTRRHGGTGLGLAIARELARRMGGDLSVESSLGRGSSFLATVRLQPVAGEVARGEAVQPPSRPLRVLAAEDNRVNQVVLQTLLGQLGMAPAVVANGREAVVAWEDGDWDIILMDVQMPVIDGPTAAQIIRAREAQTGRARTPIVAVTANAMAHQVGRYFEAGMDGVVAKPIELAHLLTVMDEALRATSALEACLSG